MDPYIGKGQKTPGLLRCKEILLTGTISLSSDDVLRPAAQGDCRRTVLRILLFRVLYWGPLFSETPTSRHMSTSMLAVGCRDVVLRRISSEF